MVQNRNAYKFWYYEVISLNHSEDPDVIDRIMYFYSEKKKTI